MRICLTPKVGGGGPASFQSRLEKEFRRRGVEVTYNLQTRPLDAVLVFAGTRRLDLLAQCKRDGIPVVQRLDGINWLHRRRQYPLAYTLRAEARQWLLRIIRNWFAQRVIYQSRFVRAWWEGWYGPSRTPNRVIWNGVDLAAYSPHQKSPDGTLLVVEGNLHYHPPAVRTIQMLDAQLIRTGVFSRLLILGELDQEWRRGEIHPSLNVITGGMLPREEVRRVQQSASVFISMELNPPCPNAVIESLASGLPVAGFDTGSLRELVGDGGIVVPYAGDPWKLEIPANIGALCDAADSIRRNWKDFSQRARAEAEKRFSIADTADGYLEVLAG